MKRIALLLLALVSFISVYSQPEEQIVPEDKEIIHGVLPNGLTYYVVGHYGKIANFFLIQKTGTIVETEEERGMSHLLEHMLFKGTKHFPGNSMTNFMDRIGMKRGADSNAYTTYDLTCYEICNVPVFNKSTLDSCLQILRDMSADAIIDRDALDSERKVVEEERRYRDDSLTEKVMHELYAGTVLENSVIGKSEVINNCSQEQLMAFYKKWYQPQNQIIVADVPLGAFGMSSQRDMEKKIIALFGDLERGDNVPLVTLPDPIDEPKVAVVRSKDLHTVNININNRFDNPYPDEMCKVKFMEKEKIGSYARRILSTRLDKIKDTDSRIDITTQLQKYYIESKAVNNELRLETSPEIWKDAFKIMLTEVERLKRLGPSDKELDEYLMRGNPSVEKLKRGGNISWKLPLGVSCQWSGSMSDFLYTMLQKSCSGKRNISFNTEYILQEYIASHLTKNEMQQVYKNLYSRHNCTIEIYLPDDPSIVAPTKDELLAIWDDVEKLDIQDLQKDVCYPRKHVTDISSCMPTTIGSIVSSKPAKHGYTEHVLSNGVKVLLAKGEKNSISATIDGGMSLLEDAELPYLPFLVEAPSNYDDLIKGGVHVDFDEAQTTYEIDGQRDELEIMLMALRSRLTSDNVDSSKFSAEKKILSDILKSQTKLHMCDMLTFQYMSPVRRNYPYTQQIIDTLNIDGLKQILRKLHKNYNGMVVTINSPGNTEIVKDLIMKYFGTLPSESTPSEWKLRPENHFKDHDDKAVAYTDETKPLGTGSLFVGLEKGVTVDNERKTYLNALESVLNSLLQGRIRDEHGDVYTIEVKEIGLQEKPFGQLWFRIEFPCAPEKTESILADVKNVLREAADGNIITQQLLDNYVNYKKKMFRGFKFHQDEVDNLKSVKAITVESLRNFLKDMLDNGHTYEYAIRTK